MILVYSVKSYCVLKMSENKEEIRYILKFYYKKGKNATQTVKKFVRFMNMMQYQYVWHKAGSTVFNLEIFVFNLELYNFLIMISLIILHKVLK